MDEHFCEVDALGCIILRCHVAVLESPMNLDLGPAFTRAQAVVNGLVAGVPFPTQQILFHDQTEDSDGDRARQREGWPARTTGVPASRKVADAIRHLSGSKPRGAEGE